MNRNRINVDVLIFWVCYAAGMALFIEWLIRVAHGKETIMLSLKTTLAERLQYDPQNVSHDELHDMALDLEAWRELGDSPQDVQEQIDELEEWQEVGDSPQDVQDQIDNLRYELDEAKNSSDNWEDRYEYLVRYLSNNYAMDTLDAKTLELMGEG